MELFNRFIKWSIVCGEGTQLVILFRGVHLFLRTTLDILKVVLCLLLVAILFSIALSLPMLAVGYSLLLFVGLLH